MSTITTFRHVAQLTLASAILMFTGAAANSQAPAATSSSGPGVPGREVQRLAAEARTADLRGNWDGLLQAHHAIETLPASTSRAWIDYYLGYIDWRQSALAFLAEGMAGTAADRKSVV